MAAHVAIVTPPARAFFPGRLAAWRAETEPPAYRWPAVYRQTGRWI